MKKLVAAFCLFAAPLFASGASAAPISWALPTAIASADAALGVAGSIEYAVAWTGLGNPTAVTLTNGTVVNFQSGAINGSGAVGVSGAYGICGTNCANYTASTNAAFNTVMGGFAFDGTPTVTLTGLTVGKSYSVQIFSVDDRGCCGLQQQLWSDGLGNVSAAYRHDANRYIIGSFVADALTQNFYGSTVGTGPCGGGQCTNINAVVLRSDAVPEPAMLGLFGMGAIGLALSRRRRV